MADTLDLFRLSATDAARMILEGTITSEALVASCLERIRAREPVVQAWAHLDPELALEQARARDRSPPDGPLHGVPIGVKDIIDTADMPTGCGSPIYAGYRPDIDADCVARARRAGAVILGKTVSTEFAYLSEPKTNNPHNPEHTPGGSSSGSAAAIGDCMVPLALGTQTGGSTIRPAAYCGAFGFKPTYNRIDVSGVKPLSVSFDTVGLIARSVDDLALLESALSDVSEPETAPPPLPRIAYCPTPFWDETEAATRQALADARTAFGKHGTPIEEVGLPEEIRELSDGHARIMATEAAAAFDFEYREHYDGLSKEMRHLIETGRTVSPNEIQRIRRVQMFCAQTVDRLFDHHDVILTPTCAGEAEKGHAVGNNVFNRIWTAMHMPCVTIPSSKGPNGLPVGVQLIGRAGSDHALLAMAKTLSGWLLP